MQQTIWNQETFSFYNEFSKSLRDHLEALVRNRKNTHVDELEFRLGQFTDKGYFNPKFTVPVFSRTVDYLQKRYADTPPTTLLQLDISLSRSKSEAIDRTLSDLRARFNGINNIQKCWKKEAALIEDKKGLVNTSITDYDLRISSSTESKVSGEIGDRFFNAINNPNQNKFYRYKKRYSWKPTESVRWDLTVIKESFGNSFQASNVANKDEKYELEIEYLAPIRFREKPGDPVTNEQIDAIYDEILTAVFPSLLQLVRTYQDSYTIVSNSDAKAVLKAYNDLLKFNDIRYPIFAGVDPLPLTYKHLIPNSTTNKMPIEDKWATPKADGERQLVYVYSGPNKSLEGRIYLINTRLQTRGTGLTSNQVDSLFDAELVRLFTGKSAVLIFDALFSQGKDLREGGEALPLPDRLKYVQEFVPSVAEIATEAASDAIIDRLMADMRTLPDVLFDIPKISAKEYFPLTIPADSDMTTPLAWNRLILNGGESGSWDYKLDGIIFTPVNPYPKVAPRKSRKWDALNKWKPVEQLSNDFLVQIRKDNKGKDIVYSASVLGRGRQDVNIPIAGEVAGPEQIQRETTNRSYKALLLQSFQIGRDKKKLFVNFTGSPPFKDGIHNVAYVPVENDGTIRTIEDRQIIYDDSVVEFIWTNGNPPKGQWVPLRFRVDKTETKLPNHIDTARSNWDLIVSPITEAMITGEEPVPRSYYAQVDRSRKNLNVNMRKFHNQIKKEMLAACVGGLSGDTVRLLDIGTGQGGDLQKWMGSNPKKPLVNYVLGVENNLNNLIKSGDGAFARYEKVKASGTPMEVKFVWADGARYLNNGAGGHTLPDRFDYSKELQYFFTERGSRWFDLVSCNFALHYFLKEPDMLSMLLYNVYQNLKNGGYFYGVTMMGEMVFDALRKLSVGQSLTGLSKSVKIWEITKQYNEDRLLDAGQQIDVFNVSISDEAIPEYLVNFDYLFETARKFGLVPIPNRLGKFSAKGGFAELETASSNLSPEEKEYSFLNGYFILTKNEDIANEPENVAFRTDFLNRTSIPEELAPPPATAVVVTATPKKTKILIKKRPT